MHLKMLNLVELGNILHFMKTSITSAEQVNGDYFWFWLSAHEHTHPPFINTIYYAIAIAQWLEPQLAIDEVPSSNPAGKIILKFLTKKKMLSLGGPTYIFFELIQN